MNRTALIVDGLSKQYRLGIEVGKSRLGEVLANVGKMLVRRPANWFRDAPQEKPSPAVQREFWALRDVSFEVQEGEVFGIIGHNGAGKSTLLKILSRITEPTTGGFRVRGRVGSLLEVGTGFHPELTGRENIMLNGAILGMGRREIRSKFDEIIAFADIEKFLDTPVKHYSSGMYVRLGFAIAAHLEPEVLIIDEVLAVGDANFQQKCVSKMNEVTRHGRTVIVVSHNLPLVVNLCQRALLLKEGQAVAFGPPVELIDGYLCSAAQNRGGSVEWPDLATAPGNNFARLTAVRIIQDERVTGAVDIGRDVVVEFEYEVIVPASLWHASLWLKDASGYMVLASANLPSMCANVDQWVTQEKPPGRYRSRCMLPANFLNDGKYSVSAIIANTSLETQIIEDRVLGFEVIDNGEMRAEFLGQWAGVVRPRLVWSTTVCQTQRAE